MSSGSRSEVSVLVPWSPIASAGHIVLLRLFRNSIVPR